MTGKRYSAGAIFLQVVPVFANVQRAIQDEAKEWDKALGDSMERSGEKAGDRAGKAASKKITEHLKDGSEDYAGHFETQIKNAVRSAEKELKRLDFSTASDGLLADLREAKAILKGLRDQDFTVDFDAKKVLAKMATLQGIVDGLTRGEHEINIDSNIRKVSADIKAALTFVDREVEKRREIKIDTDIKGAEREISAFEKHFRATVEKMGRALEGELDHKIYAVRKKLETLLSKRIGIDIDTAEAQASLNRIAGEIREIQRKHPEVDIKIATAGALAEAAAFQKRLDAIDGRTVKVNARVDNKGAVSGLRALVNGGDDAANSFRSFNIVLLAAAGLGPALIPMLAGIAGGLLAIGPAAAVAGAGLGSVLIGFSGLGPALQALGNQQDQAARTSQSAANTQRSAAYAIADAEQALADARRNAARAAEDAADRVRDARQAAAEAVKDALDAQKDAQEAYRDSVLEVKEAEAALREARREAADNGAEIDVQIRENQLAIDQAMLDAFNATVTYDAVQADGSSTNAEQEQARIDMEEAQMRLDELRKQQRELAKEKRKWDKEGVEGTEEVQNAQEDLNDAYDRQKDALEALRDAEQAVAEARRDGAESVREALEAQRETAADNARSIADAQEALRRANEGYAQSMEQVDAQAAAVDAAMSKLGPAGQRFVRFLFGMREGFYRLRDDIQSVMLPAIQEAIEGFLSSDNAGTGRNILIDLAEGFGKFTKALSTSLQGPAWGAFFDMLDRLGPKIMKQYGDGFISFMEAIASILAAAGPLALDFAKGFSGLMDAFAGWARSKEGQEAIKDFIGYFERVGPEVLDFLGAFASAAANLVVALAPWGELVLNTLTKFLEWIAAMDPQILGAVVSGLLALITASQIAYAVMNLLLAGGALFASTLGSVIFVLGAVVAAIAVLYTQNEDFRNFVNKAWGEIRAAIGDAFVYLQPHLEKLGDAFMELWDKVLQPFVKWLGKFLIDYIVFWIPILAKWWGFLADAIVLAIKIIIPVIEGIVWVIEKVVDAAVWLWDVLFGHSVFPDLEKAFADWGDAVGVIFDAVGAVFTWLWKNVAEPIGDFIMDHWGDVAKAFRLYWNLWLKPVLTLLGEALEFLWNHVAKPIFGFIVDHWEGVATGIKNAWNKYIRPTWDDLKRGLGVLWRNVIRPTLGFIKDKWDEMADGLEAAWENVIEPMFDFIKDKALPKLSGAFEKAVEAIQKVWNTLKKVVGTPIYVVLETIINDGLIDGFNKVADFVKIDGIDRIPNTDKIPHFGNFATGGVLPGYTPGRDVHDFYSPTAGRLHLSGGEAIMRPEWTAAMGTGFVNQMNALARQGGVNAVRQAMFGGRSQAFAKGGVIWPVPKGWYVERTGYNLGHDGMDINHPNDGGPNGTGGSVPFWSATSGTVSYVGYGRGYGNATFVNSPYGELVYGHAYPGSTRTRAGQAVSPGTILGLIGMTGNASGPHLHFGFPGGTFYQAEALLRGAGSIDTGDLKGFKSTGGPSFPDWIVDIAKDPLGYVKGLIDGPLDRFKGRFDGPMADMLGKVPGAAVEGVKDKIWDILPGPLKSLVKGGGDLIDKGGDVLNDVGHGLDSVTPGDGVPGFKNGGILPYNGTMKYDNGGYLPPGITSVVNLTGKPEPVFTADQWSQMEGTGADGGTIHYEPHFEGSNLTAEDVAGDMNFAFRRLRRGGKYAGVGR